jgi:hypothetical protein
MIYKFTKKLIYNYLSNLILLITLMPTSQKSRFPQLTIKIPHSSEIVHSGDTPKAPTTLRSKSEETYDSVIKANEANETDEAYKIIK